MANKFITDYREDLPNRVARLDSVPESQTSFKRVGFTLLPDTDKQTEIKLEVGHTLPIGSTTCSGWKIADILEEKVHFVNGCVLSVGDYLCLTETEQDKREEAKPVEAESQPESEASDEAPAESVEAESQPEGDSLAPLPVNDESQGG